MDKFLIERSTFLKGSIEVDGSKNSALPILASCILSSSKVKLKRVPFLSDIHVMCEILEFLGAKIEKDIVSKTIEIDTTNICNNEIPCELFKKIRASFLIAGPILARFKKAYMYMPGGCQIGVRPIDLHLKGFISLGANIDQKHGVIELSYKDKLEGNEVYLDFPSVGATENIIMAASLAKGETIISNCATEPEIIDLANFINKMGGKIEGAGTETIKVTGVEKLNGATHTIIPDRIEAGTFLVLAAATRSNLEIMDINCEHLKSVTYKLRELNINVEEKENSIKVLGNNILKNIDIQTMPYPGFPTDMQPQFMSLMTMSKGTGIVNETVFENRFMHVNELSNMGANISVKGSSAVIKGVDKITGTKLKATDLRAGAGLIIAGLCAEGQSEISDIYHVDRGYYKIEEKLEKIGAKIKRIKY